LPIGIPEVPGKIWSALDAGCSRKEQLQSQQGRFESKRVTRNAQKVVRLMEGLTRVTFGRETSKTCKRTRALNNVP